MLYQFKYNQIYWHSFWLKKHVLRFDKVNILKLDFLLVFCGTPYIKEVHRLASLTEKETQ